MGEEMNNKPHANKPHPTKPIKKDNIEKDIRLVLAAFLFMTVFSFVYIFGDIVLKIIEENVYHTAQADCFSGYYKERGRFMLHNYTFIENSTGAQVYLNKENCIIKTY